MASAVSASEIAGAQWVIPETAVFVLGGEENVLGRGAYGEVRAPGGSDTVSVSAGCTSAAWMTQRMCAATLLRLLCCCRP